MTNHPKCSSVGELDSLCKEIGEKVSNGFEQLTKNTIADLNQNKKWANEYYSLLKSNNKLEKQIKRLKVGRWFLIIFLVFPFVLMTKSAKKKQALLDSGSKQESNVKRELDNQVGSLISEINYDFCFNRMIESIWTDIDFDVYQDSIAFKSWVPLMKKIIKEDTCVNTLTSGHLFSNPFIVYNYKSQKWRPHIYTGSVPVSYSVHVNGQWTTRTTVVTASETLPEPYWVVGTRLAYHFDRAEKLCFSNNCSKHEYKKWNKKEQTHLENKRFEKLFPTIRNDEKDFRVLFTPLAQENFIKLLEEQKYYITKDEEVTIVQVANRDDAYLDVTPNEAFNYNVEDWKNNYVKWVQNFVKNIGLLTLPIANIPLYTHFETKTHPKETQRVASDLQVEDNISYLFDIFDKWKNFETDVIFEPVETVLTTIGKTKFSLTTVKCRYFWPERKLVTKPAVGPNGRTVMVPINVIVYHDRYQNMVVGQSVSYDENANEMVYANNIAIHRGQVMFLYEGKKIPDATIKSIQNILSKK